MPRLASLFLPWLAIDRIRRSERRPESGPQAPACSFPAVSLSRPRAPGFRPGARWAWDEHAPGPTGESGGRALATVERGGPRILLAAVSPVASSLGLVPGMPLTQARLLVSDLEVRDSEPEGDAAFLARLARAAARRWTPRAAVSRADGLWLDLSGVAHLFGGEPGMCARIVETCARLGLVARIAVAGTAGAAHALARFGGDPIRILPDGDEPGAIAPLPVAALRLDPETLDAVRRLGIDTIGALAAMPRAPLQRRFGPELLLRLDQALGRVPEPLDPVFPEEPVSVLLRFVEPIATAEAIAEAMAEGVRRLVGRLRRSALGVRALDLACDRVDGAEQRLVIGTARATRDPVHLLRLLEPRIEEIEPGFGLERMRLVARRVEPLGPEAIGNGLAEDGTGDAGLVPLIDRLVGRLGKRKVYRQSSVESDVPERSLRRISPLGDAESWPDWPRPVRLLSPPEPVSDVLALLPDQPPRRFTWRGRSYRVRQADGPERIHGEWWKRTSEAAAVRDYFRVEDEAGQRFWLFRRGDGEDPRTGDLRWYLHGMFG